MKAIKLFIAIMLLGMTMPMQAQLSKEQLKARQEIQKASKAELTKKATKAAVKEAKQLKKEGWKVNPGALPIEKQLDKSYMMQNDFDENLFPKYIMGEARSVGENYDAAKMQAQELAKINLASNIHSEITALVENTVTNSQLAPEEATSVVKSTMNSKSLIEQSLGRTLVIVEMTRTLENKNKEVLIRLACSEKEIKAVAKEAIRKQLEIDGDKGMEKLDEILGW